MLDKTLSYAEVDMHLLVKVLLHSRVGSLA
jgi:hypothetical protein